MKYKITAQRLREAMQDKNVSAQEIANATNINKASISQYYNGSHKPSNIKAALIGEYLGVDPLWLMGFDVNKTPLSFDYDPEWEEQELLALWRKASEYAKDNVILLLKADLERSGLL